MTTPSTSTRPLLTLISPTLYLAAVFHRLLSTTTLFLLLRSLVVLRQAYYISQLLLLRCARNVNWMKSRSWSVSEKLRNKLYFEVMVFVLGGGNGVLLLLFWPGWILIWVIWMIWG